ncbi:NAD(P)/FAD-dependent oxidoreductase, partial [Corynebacterium propinquum]
LFQPMLYQVATGLVSAGEIAPSTRQLLRKQNNVDVVRGEVTAIDIEKQTVTASQGDIVKDFAYDSLVVAAGSNQGYFGNNHFAQYAPGMKSIDDALEIRSRLLGAFERAELTDDPEERARLLTFVIIGAGPTGVELAGQLAELSKRGLKGTFKNISPESAKIILLDGAPQVLPPFGKKLGKKAQRTLEKQGIEVRLNAMVSEVDDDKVVYKNMTDDSVHTI